MGLSVTKLRKSYCWVCQWKCVNRWIFGKVTSKKVVVSCSLCAWPPQGHSYIEARGGNCRLLVIWQVILHVTWSHKRTKDVVTRCAFESPNAFESRALGELQCSPRFPNHMWGEKGGKKEGKGSGWPLLWPRASTTLLIAKSWRKCMTQSTFSTVTVPNN